MSIKNTLRMAGVMCAAVVAGLLAVQGTWALWNVQTAAGAQSVQAADFQINLNGRRTIVAGEAVSLSLGDVGALVPGASVHAPVNVTVPTNASAAFDVTATLGTPAVSSTSVAALTANLRFETAVAPASGRCAEVTSWYPTASAPIGKGGAAAFCVRITLASAAPASVRGASATISVPVGISQNQGAA